MNNILLDDLPNEWNGYIVNTWFQIGVQLFNIMDDADITEMERAELIIILLFGNEDGSIREYPQTYEEVEACVKWFLHGWYHDNDVEHEDNGIRLMDYDVDQWRIYADFLQIYHIDLYISDMHWWMFQGLLWNMPVEQSSFMQCLQIRQKKPRKGASSEEKKAIELGHKRFDLNQKKIKNKSFSSEEQSKIDDYDRMMEEIKRKRLSKNEDLV